MQKLRRRLGGGAVRSLYYMTDGGEWCALCVGVAMEDVTWSDGQALKVRAVSAADASWGQGAVPAQATAQPSTTASGEHRGDGMGGRMHGMQTLTRMHGMRTDFFAPLRSTWGAFPNIRWRGAAPAAEASHPARRHAGDDGISLIVDSNVQWSLSNAGLSRRPGHS